jgi:hypothetical protein
MNKFYKASVLIFSGVIGLAGCNEQPQEPTAKIEVSKAETPSATSAVVTPAPVAVPAPAIVAPPKPYEATLAEGIDFKKPLYPTFIADVTGMSGYEPTIRWSEGPLVKFRFKQVLPKKFTLEIVASAYANNEGVPVKVRVGDVEKSFVITNLKAPAKAPSVYSLSFKTDGKSDTLEITPPKPTSPQELNPKNGDNRKLGIAFVTLKIKS